MSEERSATDLPSEEWLPLGKAADLLGVHSMTLRRWSDSGRFPSYRTAGGHRRFARNDIRAYLSRRRNSQPDALSAAWANSALVQTRREVASHESNQWLQTIEDRHLRDDFRDVSHQLMGLLLQYLAADEPNGAFVEEAQRLGRRYGGYGMRAGLSLRHVLEATIFFRDIMVESSLQIPTTTFVEPAASLRILRRVNQIINAVQLAVTDYYSSSSGGRYWSE